MFLSKAKIAMVLVLAVGIVSATCGLARSTASGEQAKAVTPAASAPEAKQQAAQSTKDPKDTFEFR
jgi:hypothetical protein